MARKGFLDGLLTGGLLGMVMGLFFVARLKPETRETLMQARNRVQEKAGEFIRRRRQDVGRVVERWKK